MLAKFIKRKDKKVFQNSFKSTENVLVYEIKLFSIKITTERSSLNLHIVWGEKNGANKKYSARNLGTNLFLRERKTNKVISRY